MTDFHIALPSKPAIISEEEFEGTYEIEGLHPGYGHTLGNSLRRIILSSLSGFTVTAIKIDGVSHEFSTIPGVTEDVVALIINLKKIKFKISGDEPHTLRLKAKGLREVTAGDIEVPGQVEIANPKQLIARLNEKNALLDMEIFIEKGMGYVPKEMLHKDKADIGLITFDATFTPIRRVSYEVENMRVGNRTDFNKLRITIETDGSLSPKEALEKSIQIMLEQLQAVVGFQERVSRSTDSLGLAEEVDDEKKDSIPALKTKIEDLNLSLRTQKALAAAGIRTVSGLARKKEADIVDIPGLGDKALQEIKEALSTLEIYLMSE